MPTFYLRELPFLFSKNGLSLAVALLLAGCALGPAYQRPVVEAPAAWKEAPAVAGWLPAAPADSLARGDWWTLFGDTTLDQLAAQVQVSNQNIAAAVASVAQARALVGERDAARLPSVGLSGSAQRAGGEGNSRSGGGSGGSNSVSASLGASWELDVWGRLKLLADSARASAQASEADLAAARLSALGTLASSYLQLRAADAEAGLLRSTVQGYERSLQIAQNRYAAGVAAQTDVLQAQTQLANTRADLAGVLADRAKLEHAIAVLTGVAPGGFTLPVAHGVADAASWMPVVPAVPVVVPSALLQRRPDIASAERAVAAANAQIGIQRAAYFPSLSLGATLGSGGSSVADLFKASGTVWSLGLSIAQTVFDAGATAARVEEAQAARDARVAVYRQTVLTAFQSVEDQLTVLRTLREQEPLRREAVSAAERTAQQLLNRYRAGQVGYTEVVTAQAAALSARRALLQLQVNRQLAVVALVQALGGGWQARWQPPA